MQGAVEYTCDRLEHYSLELMQPLRGYRYSLDPFLLAHFCAAIKPAGNIIDLGAGGGIISLLLARLNPAAELVAVENDSAMAALAERNVRHNDFAGRVTVHAEDVINLLKRYPVSHFDMVVSNPPFRSPRSGKISPHAGRDSARHETTAGLADFMAAAKYLVKPAGRICFIYHPSRLAEFIATAVELKLALLRLRMVHGTVGAEAKMFLAELAKGRRGDVTIEAPLIVYDDQGEYTAEVEKMLGGRKQKT
jgi:tRNA1Val (adenine37-N6)-methyltransferase